MRIGKQKERSRNARGCESDRARPTSYKPEVCAKAPIIVKILSRWLSRRLKKRREGRRYLSEMKRSNQGANYRREGIYLGRKKIEGGQKWKVADLIERGQIPSHLLRSPPGPGISSLSPDPFLLHLRPPPRPGRRGTAPSITSTTAPQRATNTSTIALPAPPSPPAPTSHRATQSSIHSLSISTSAIIHHHQRHHSTITTHASHQTRGRGRLNLRASPSSLTP